MKRSTLPLVGALLIAAVPNPALAQHVSPPNTAVTAGGPVVITPLGSGSLTCTLTMMGTTGADIGGAHAGHALGGTITSGPVTGAAVCPLLSINAASGPSFSISSIGMGGGTGVFNAIELGICGPPGGATVPFTITNTSATTSMIEIGATIGTCFVEASLSADFTVVS